MVFLKISINAHPRKRIELLLALRSLADKISQERGCVNCHIFQDVENENNIKLEEEWENRFFLDAHLQTDMFSALLGAVKLLGETHEIQINDGSHTEGPEAVDAIRSKGTAITR